MAWYDDAQQYGQYAISPASWILQDNGGNPATNYGGLSGPGQMGAGTNLGNANLPYFQQDRDRLQGLLNGRNPFASGDWDSVIASLKDRAMGNGMSQAGMAFQKASQEGVNNLASLSQGSANPEMARTALIQQGRMGQGLAAGYAQAQMAEQAQNSGLLNQALTGRDQLNQNAYLQILQQQLGLSQQQLRALLGDQQFANEATKNANDAQAAKYKALSDLMNGMGKAVG